MADRRKPDHYSNRAKKEGYPARSVYKLQEIQEKYSLIKPGMTVLDIGAAPGSWSIFVQKALKGKGRLVAVDLKEMTLPSASTPHTILTGDVFDGSVSREIASIGPYGLILSDAAPSTTGNATVDTGRSYSLVEGIILLSDSLLDQGGALAVKVFQGGDEQELYDLMRERFTSIKRFKPKAVRKESFETYFIGAGKKENPQ